MGTASPGLRAHLARGCARVATSLGRPLRWPWRVAGWLAATATFIGVVAARGGPVRSDAFQSTVASWAIAHGHLACGYGVAYPSPAPTAPVYVFLAGGIAAVLRIGGTVAFPSGAQLGANCARAYGPITAWAQHAHAVTPTLWIGVVGWVGLAAGVVVLLEACGRGGSGFEVLALVLIAAAPTTALCLVESFHPQDLLALGFALAAVAAVRTARWATAGVLLGVAFATQQYTLLVLVPIVVVAGRGRRRLVAGAATTLVAITAAVGVVTSGRGLPSVFAGTGKSVAGRSAVSSLLHYSHNSYLVARICPLVFAALLALLARSMLGERALERASLVSLVAASIALRLPFEVATWGYYLMATGVLLIVLVVVTNRNWLGVLAWFLLVMVALANGHVVYAPYTSHLAHWVWQLVIDLLALLLAVEPLAQAIRARHRPRGVLPRTAHSRDAAAV